VKLDDLDLAGGAVLFVARGPLPDGLVRTEDRQRLGYQADHSILEVLVDAVRFGTRKRGGLLLRKIAVRTIAS
jgi:hypothetical protein